jgi:signal transduction histidine kinase
MRGDVANDETLAWEARQRPRAAIAASAAAVLIIASYVISGAVFADVPRSGVLDAIDRAAQPGSVNGAPSLTTPRYQFYSDNAAAVIASSAVRAIGFLLIGLALTFLALATRSRTPQFPKLALYVPIVGAVLSAISYLVSPIGTLLAVQKYLDGPRTVEAAQDVSTSSLVTTAALIGFVGQLAIALAFVLICLNAMRVGLLTRFMGVLGILSGVLTLIPVGSPLPVVQCFWLGALAVLFLGRWPKGDPPAWRTGNAEPWPTQQQLREARRGGNAETGGEGRSRERESGSVAAVAASSGERQGLHPSSKKKKRKRRG